MYGGKEKNGERISGYLRDICQYTGLSAHDALAFALALLADEEVFHVAVGWSRGKERHRDFA